MKRGVSAGFSKEDQRAMRLALTLAEKGRGTTRPNPVVGAVLVKNGRVLARGFHRRAGLPHAEREALERAGASARGGTLYVTLEPCCHSGRTGPCTVPIIEAGVTRVVVGCRDPNPLVCGQGIARLRRAGIRVEVGCLEAECREANRGFFRWIKEGRPFVTLKVAATLDGFIAAPKGRTSPRNRDWITGNSARRAAHAMRAAHDAVLVGAGTVLADDPRLTVRLANRTALPTPVKVVLDGRLRTPARARLLWGGRPASAADGRSSGRPLVIGVRPSSRNAARTARLQRRLERAGAEVLLLPGDRARLPIRSVLRALAARGVQSVLVEGGSEIHAAFVSSRLVDAVAFFYAPRLAGAGVPIVQGGGLGWRSPIRLGPLTPTLFDGDVLLTAEVLRPGRDVQR